MRLKFKGIVGEISTLPGCSQVAVSHSLFRVDDYKGDGNATAANFDRQAHVFTELGYDCMICTVTSDNAVQKHILRKAGWEFLSMFTSRKTGNVVELWACYNREF